LSFSLDEASPPDAAIDVATGVFAWTTTEAEINTTNSITVQVTDDGEPSLSATATFSVIVRPRPALAVSISGNTATLTWNAISNTAYQVQYKTNLANLDWSQLGPQITATNTIASVSDTFSPAFARRFYRVFVLVP